MASQTKNKRNKGWGLYLVAAIIVAALCLAILLYIGWFNQKTHVDSRQSDVMEEYPIETGRPASPGENDWQNPQGTPAMEVITHHAAGSEANAPSVTSAQP